MPTSLVLVLAVAAAGPQTQDADGFVRLFAERAEASSFLENNWNKFTENYHPSYLLDDNPKTAWVEGADGLGEGEWVQWAVSKLGRVERVKLRVRTGYQKSKGLFRANATPTKLRVELLGADGRPVKSEERTLKAKWGWQDLAFDAAGALGGVRLTVLGVKDGTKYKDTCVSDVQTWVKTKVPYDAKLEKARHAALLRWVGERRKEAAYFKKLPKKYPFAGTKFDGDMKEKKVAFRECGGPASDCTDEQTLMKRLSKGARDRVLKLQDFGGRPHSVVHGQRVAPPDGADWRWGAEGCSVDIEEYCPSEECQIDKGSVKAMRTGCFYNYLAEGETSFFEAKGDVAAVVVEPMSKTTTHHPSVEWRVKGKAPAFVLIEHDVEEDGREGMGWVTKKTLLAYDDAGQVSDVTVWRHNKYEEMIYEPTPEQAAQAAKHDRPAMRMSHSWDVSFLRFSRADDGRVSAVDVEHASAHSAVAVQHGRFALR
jgi:hypothetical protein